ncbi:MAG: DUF6655 family protein [Planctomycetaceae bacterium]
MISRIVVLILLASVSVGCGSTSSRTATEQLLESDAVDAAIAQIDFRPLANQKIYFNKEYIKDYKGVGFVNSDYIVSSLRQQMVTCGCLLQDTKEDADFIIEGRVGALGTDSHEIVYGLPANNVLNAATSLAPNVPTVPTIPEIALSKKKDELSAAKIAVFAYHQETKRRVWQSGISLARSTAKDTWFFGAGPFQSGTVYDGIKFAGSELELKQSQEDPAQVKLSNFRQSSVFTPASAFAEPPAVVAEQPATANAADGVVPASAEVQSVSE